MLVSTIKLAFRMRGKERREKGGRIDHLLCQTKVVKIIFNEKLVTAI